MTILRATLNPNGFPDATIINGFHEPSGSGFRARRGPSGTTVTVRVTLPTLSRVSFASMYITNFGASNASIRLRNANLGVIASAGSPAAGWQASGLANIVGSFNHSNVKYVDFVNEHPFTGANRHLTIDNCYIEFEPHEQSLAVCSNSGASDCSIGAYAGMTALSNPVSALSGEKWEQVTDLRLNTPSGALEFTRSYRQDRHALFDFMGLGWTHNHAVFLDDTNPDQIIVQLAAGGEAIFEDPEIGGSATTYTAVPGVSSSLEKDNSSGAYTLTTVDGQRYEFDSDGLLQERLWPNGDRWVYTYSGGKLAAVTDDDYVLDGSSLKRGLVFRYYTSGPHDGQLYRVGDHTFDDTDPGNPTGRYVEYSYIPNAVESSGVIIDGAQSLLKRVRDVRAAGGADNQQWEYSYYNQIDDLNQLNFLTEYQTPLVDTDGDSSVDVRLLVERLTYTMNGSSVTQIVQERGIQGAAAPLLETGFAFQPNGQNITTETIAGRQTTHKFQGTVYAGMQNAAGHYGAVLHGQDYRPAFIKDARGNTSMMLWEKQGKQLAYLSDAFGNGTRMLYDLEDRLECLIDAEGRRTIYVYDTPAASRRQPSTIWQTNGSNLVVGGDMEINNGWTAIANAAPLANQLVTAPTYPVYSGHQARRVAADTAGQGIESTAVNLTAGRRYLVFARVYPLNGTVRMQGSNTTAFNQTSSGTGDWEILQAAFTPTSNLNGMRLQFAADGGAAEFFVDTVYVLDHTMILRWQQFAYDGKGRTLSEQMIDPADGTTVLAETTRSYYSSGNGNGLLESLTQVDVQTPANNTSSIYTYDSLGRVVKTQKTSLFGTCEFTYTVYDAAGNVVAAVCGLQNTTVPGDVAAALAMYDAGDSVKKFNRVTTYEYDPLGRRVKTTTNDGSGNPLKQTTVTLYDALGRVVRTIGNYVVQGTSAPGDWVWDAADKRWEDGAGNAIAHGSENNQNIINDTAYNARGLTRMTRDVLGNVTLFGYDDADRLVKTVRGASTADYNNDYLGIDPDPSLEAYSAATEEADQDVISQTVYDAVGNPIQVIDARGSVTFTIYDALNRPVKVLRNAKAGATIALNVGDSGYAAENDPRSTAYAASADPAHDQLELTEYDALGRVVRTRRLLENRDGADQWDVTLLGYDALGRQVKTIRAASQSEYNLAADPALSAYVPSSAADRDIISTASYSAEGRVLAAADVNGTLTRSVYDGLGRQVRTIASYVANVEDPASWLWDAGDERWEQSDGTPIAHGTDNDENIISATTFNGDGQLEETLDTAGRRTHHVYDGQGRRIRTISSYAAQGMSSPADWLWDAGDERWEDGAGNAIAQHSDAGAGKKADINRISDTVYDDHGRVVKSIDHRRNVILYGYDLVGRRVKTVQNASNPDGTFAADLSDYSPDGAAEVDQDRITGMLYDIAGRVTATLDAAGSETRSIYDALGRQVLVISNYVTPGGGVNPDPAAWGWDETHLRWQDDTGLAIPHGDQFDQNLISQTIYNQAGQVLATRDTRGTQTAFSYDAAGRRLTITAAAGSPQAVTSHTCYDKAGRVRRTIANYLPLHDGLGQAAAPDARTDNAWDFAPQTHGAYNDQNLITEYLYDALGRRVTTIDPLGNSTTMLYAKDGQAQAVTDPEGSVTAYRYDKLRRRKLVVQGYVPQGTSDPATWVWDAGQSRWEQQNGTAIVHGADSDQNIIVQVSYNKLGQMTSLRDPRGSLTQYDYDRLQRRVRLTNPISKDWLTNHEDLLSGGVRTSMTYPGINGGGSYSVQRDSDRLARPVSIVYGDPTTTPDVRFSYDAAGNRSHMTEYSGASFSDPVRETIYGYDARHRLTSVGFDTDGDTTVEETVTYAYDVGGLKTSLTMPGGLTLSYQYNARGQLIAMTDWDDQRTSFAYDNAGRQIATQRHNGLRSRYAYDAAGRLRLLRHDVGSKTLAHFAYTVDKRGNRTSALEALRQPDTGTTTIAHDDPEVSYSGSWSVVGDYHETTQTDARLHLLFFGGGEVTLKMGRGPDHGLYDIYIGKALWQSIDGYNAGAAERTISIPLDGDGPHLLEIRNRAERSKASSGYKLRFRSLAVDGAYTLHTIQYQYDALSRLLRADYHPGDNSAAPTFREYAYSYDLAGNRLAESLTLNGGSPAVTNYGYNAANQLTGGSIAYDNNGNLTNDGTNGYTWDRANRLLSMGGSSYSYDGNGNRIQQTVSSVVTDYLLDIQPGLVKVIAQTTSSDTERFIHSPRGIHAMQDAAGIWTNPLQDGLGSVRMEASAALAVDSSQNFAPYGTPFDLNGSFDTPFGFTGEQTDANDLIFLRARYYYPAAGVFTALDPFEGMAGRPMSRNGYSWVEGNPNNTDPSGRCPADGPNASKCEELCEELSDWGVNVVYDQEATLPCLPNSVQQQLNIRQRWTYQEMHAIYNAFAIFDTAYSGFSGSYGWPLTGDSTITIEKRPAISTTGQIIGYDLANSAIYGVTDTNSRTITLSAQHWGSAENFINEISYVDTANNAIQYRSWIVLHEFVHIFTTDRIKDTHSSGLQGIGLSAGQYLDLYLPYEIGAMGYTATSITDYSNLDSFNNEEFIYEAVTGTIWNQGYSSVANYDINAGGRTGGRYTNVMDVTSTASVRPGYRITIRAGDNIPQCRFVNIPIAELPVGTPLEDWVMDRIILGNIDGRRGEIPWEAASCDTFNFGIIQRQ